jgi:hypothetical protein
MMTAQVAQGVVSVPVDKLAYFFVGMIVVGGAGMVAWIRYFRDGGKEEATTKTIADQNKEDVKELKDAVEKLSTKVSANVAELHARIDRQGEQFNLHVAAFHLYRETVAREYVHRETMKEVRHEMSEAINRLGDRFDRIIDSFTNALTKIATTKNTSE